MVLIPIGVFIIAFLFIASVAFSSFKKSKKVVNKVIPIVEQSFNEQLTEVSAAKATKPEEKVCEYCGSTVPNGKTECESCGAKVKK